MKIDVDLHAADINQLGALLSGLLNHAVSLPPALWEKGLAFDIDCVGAERPLAPGFRQSDGIENSFGNTVLAGGVMDLPLTLHCGYGL